MGSRKQVGDVVYEARPLYPRNPAKRGVVSWINGKGHWPRFIPKIDSDDPVCVVRLGPGQYQFTDFAENWHRVPLSRQTIAERIHSTWFRYAFTKRRMNPPGRDIGWHLTLAILPVDEQVRILASPVPPSLEELGRIIAQWIDPRSDYFVDKIEYAITNWRPYEDGSDAECPVYATMEWTIWTAILPQAVREDLDSGDIPDYVDLCIRTAYEAEGQRRRREILRNNLARLAS